MWLKGAANDKSPKAYLILHLGKFADGCNCQSPEINVGEFADQRIVENHLSPTIDLGENAGQ